MNQGHEGQDERVIMGHGGQDFVHQSQGTHGTHILLLMIISGQDIEEGKDSTGDGGCKPNTRSTQTNHLEKVKKHAI